MTKKTVEFIASPGEPHFVGDGFRVYNYIPGAKNLDMQRMNPFIMLDYNPKFKFSPVEKPRGVGVHPHRGFETVTIAYKGKVAHHDSAGGGGVIGEGDVQWMTAASGVLHKEYHEKEWSKNGGIFQMVQLWVNLPAKYKMSTPKYQAISNNAIKRYYIENNEGEVEVIAGNYNGINGVASTFTPINMLNARLNTDANAKFSFPSNYNTAILVIEGKIEVNNEQIANTDQLILMKNDGEDFNIKAIDNSIVLLLSGEPIDEPIAAYGPFVMNTRDELLQAFEDYKKGKFGFLED
ncbi:MAG: pirin family protein [Bacteroidia bacterium]|nr:pirin family protein [Bacteroidia bacterium]